MFLVYPAAPPPYFPYSYPTTRSDVGCTAPLGAVYFTKGKMEKRSWGYTHKYSRKAAEAAKAPCYGVANTLSAEQQEYYNARASQYVRERMALQQLQRQVAAQGQFELGGGELSIPIVSGAAVDAYFDSDAYQQEEQDAYDRYGCGIPSSDEDD